MVGGWRLAAVGGWWRLAVGGWWSLGAVLHKKLGFLKTALAARDGGVWHDAGLCRRLQRAAPIGLSALPLALAPSPLPPQAAAPLGLSHHLCPPPPCLAYPLPPNSPFLPHGRVCHGVGGEGAASTNGPQENFGSLRHAAACFKLLVKGTIIFRKRHRFVMPW